MLNKWLIGQDNIQYCDDSNTDLCSIAHYLVLVLVTFSQKISLLFLTHRGDSDNFTFTFRYRLRAINSTIIAIALVERAETVERAIEK